MTWTINLKGDAHACHKTLEIIIPAIKKNRTPTEVEHIDAAVLLFREIVPKDDNLDCYFNASGIAPSKTDVVFNYSCYVHNRT